MWYFIAANAALRLRLDAQVRLLLRRTQHHGLLEDGTRSTETVRGPSSPAHCTFTIPELVLRAHRTTQQNLSENNSKVRINERKLALRLCSVAE